MKICAVNSCANNSIKRPDLCFFNIPRDIHLRDEWLEVLNVKSNGNVSNLAVCEIHFKEKDFKAGKKKVLKAHVVPVLNLGQSDRFDSDEDYIPYDPNNDPDILEIQAETFSAITKKNIKQEPVENKDPEPSHDLEQETGRRPSRRAALVAAKKIFNTVRNFGISDSNPSDRPVNLSTSPKPANATHPYTRPKQKKIPTVNLDLQMDCNDDFLSPIQAEFLLQAQIQYNMVMKNLRELMACNVKVIQTDANGVQTVVTSAPSVNTKNGNTAVDSKSAKSKPLNTAPTVIVPMRLIRSPIVIT